MADEQEPGFLDKIVKAVKGKGKDPDAAREASEAISKKLPQAVMPRAGIEEDRRRKAMIDALKDE